MNEWIQEARLLSLGARKYGRERVKMQSLPNAVEYRNFLLLSHNIHCATFFHFHWAAFKLDPRRRLTVNGEYSNAAQKKKFHVKMCWKNISQRWTKTFLSIDSEWLGESINRILSPWVRSESLNTEKESVREREELWEMRALESESL